MTAVSFEEEDEYCATDPTTRSRCHSPKSMIMGIVAPPSPLLTSWLYQARNGWKDFKIGMIRVNMDKVVQRISRTHKFVSDGQLNELMNDGDWRQLCSKDSDEITIEEFI